MWQDDAVKTLKKKKRQGSTDKSRVKERKKGGRREDHPVVG